MTEQIVILDFGSQYTQVIARRIRECNVFSTILRYDTPASEIAALLHVHPGTMSGIIRRLESSKYVERLGDDMDARRQRLSLTAKGRQANARRAGTFEAAVRKTLATTSPTELASFEGVLARLAQALRETVDGQTAGGKLRAVARKR